MTVTSDIARIGSIVGGFPLREPTTLPNSVVCISNTGHTSGLVTKTMDVVTIDVSIDNVIYTVRYIGIDTPETVHPEKPVEPFGPEASAKNSELVEGKKVILVKDVSETDQYGRLLRCGFLTFEMPKGVVFRD